MESFTHGNDLLNHAAPHPAAASFGIPADISDDDDPTTLASPPGEEVADAWAGIEPPCEDLGPSPVTEPLELFSRAARGPCPVAPPPAGHDSQASRLNKPTVPASNKTPRREPVATQTIDPHLDPFAPAEVEAPLATIPSVAEPPEKGGWIVSILCAGIAIVSICLLMPLAEQNHQLAWQREKLRIDLAQLKEQVQMNDEFLKKISNDPTLAERLAQRQMKFIRQGSTVLDLPVGDKEELSPFQLVNLPAPMPIPPYQPLGGALSAVVRNSHLRLYLTGIGLLCLAAGLVLGGESKVEEI